MNPLQSLMGFVTPSPKLLFGIIRKQLEDELNTQRKKFAPDDPPIIVQKYKIEINCIDKQVYFHVIKKRLPFPEGAKFHSLVEQKTREEMKLKDMKLHLILIDYNSVEGITATVAFEDETGEKKQLTKTITNL